MVHNLSEERLNHLKKVAESAQPYTDEEFAELGFDGVDEHPERTRATFAKMLLDQYYAEHGGKLDEEE